MWEVLANKYRDTSAFADHRDRQGEPSVALGYEAGTQTDGRISCILLDRPSLEGTWCVFGALCDF